MTGRSERGAMKRSEVFSHPELPWARKGFRYNNYKFYLEDRFGERVQRVSLEGGFSCPNRDGTRGRGGCNYCNNESFSPAYARRRVSVQEQLEMGKRHLKARFGSHRFLAYFQSYSNTYAELSRLQELYTEALQDPDVTGLCVSTRSDCLPEETVALLGDLAERHYINVEIGIESVYDRSLEWMNRCHSMAETDDAFRRLAQYPRIDLTGHVILGLPLETEDMILDSLRVLNALPLRFLKIHHLQVIENTQLAEDYRREPFALMDYPQYLDLVSRFIAGLRPGIVLQRVFSDSPKQFLIAPKWGKTQTAIIMDLQRYMARRELYQGKFYSPEDESAVVTAAASAAAAVNAAGAETAVSERRPGKETN